MARLVALAHLAGFAAGRGAGDDPAPPVVGAATQRASWRRLGSLSSGLGRIERFLAEAGFDRAPWLAVAFGCGIAAWFAAPRLWQWIVLLAGALGIALTTLAGIARDGARPYTRQAVAGVALALAAGCATVWCKSALVASPGLVRPWAGPLTGQVIAVEDRPAVGEHRILLVVRLPLDQVRVGRVRLTLPDHLAPRGIGPGAVIRLSARLMPPAPPMLPGGHDYARSAWFDGIAATGTVQTRAVVIAAGGQGGDFLGTLRKRLSAHITTRLSGSGGGIAAALASGDRGAIARCDEDALRDAGLSHLLSVSGLHVSAVIGAAYLLVLRLVALVPWLALRVRGPLWAAGGAALAGVGYTLLTGAEVPTVRSMVGALLVLIAVALGREPLSLRLLALAAGAVMVLWPEAVMGPSFQLSFGAVLAIVALHGTAWMRTFTARGDGPWWRNALRGLAGLLLTGVVVELALLPIGLYHFHRAGIYGAVANVIAIPLTTFVTMPLIALALVLDLAGLGGPAWWLAGQSLTFLLTLAHAVAGQPGAVMLFPAMGGGAYALFLGGGLWLALWQGRIRMAGLVPVAIGTVGLGLLHPPDLLISADGRHVAINGLVPGRLALLRETRSGFARDTLNEMAALDAPPLALADAPGVRCNADFCGIDLDRGGRRWRLLLARSRDPVPVRDLAAACERADVVIADRRLPPACRPAVLKADRALLDQTGGLAIDLASATVTAVRPGPDDHGWIVRRPERPPGLPAAPSRSAAGSPTQDAPLARGGT